MRNVLIICVAFVLFCSCHTEYYTPQQFGALADGKTDCTEAIKSMLEAMKTSNNAKAVFPEGNYLISNSILIDFPCTLTGKKATIVTVDTLKEKYAFLFSKSKRGEYVKNQGKTEVSLNFKVHGIPMAFHGYNDIYVHDCTLSTYTDTNWYYKNTKFWFAVDCDRMQGARFKNIFFDQPANYNKNEYNSSDGLHITGLCKDIVIDHCYGHCGDDFIALNANEDTPGDISNVIIRHCNIGSDAVTKNGIRIYGASSKMHLEISDVLIEKCKINPINSPCIYITNAANGVYDSRKNRLTVKNFTIKNCEMHAPKYELVSGDHPSVIRLAGVDADNLRIENVKAYTNSDSYSYFVNSLGNSSFKNTRIERCKFRGANAVEILKTRSDSTKINVLKSKIVNKK